MRCCNDMMILIEIISKLDNQLITYLNEFKNRTVINWTDVWNNYNVNSNTKLTFRIDHFLNGFKSNQILKT